MKYFKYTIKIEQGNQTPSGELDITENNMELRFEDLTDNQRDVLAPLLASLVKDNKARIDKTVEAIQ